MPGTPQMRPGYPAIGVAGKEICLWVQDGSGNDIALGSAPTSGPTISINGGAPIQLSGGFWNSTFPFIIYPLGVTVQATDVITYSTQASWLTTSIGALPSITNGVVSNLTGGAILPAFNTSQKTMKVGIQPSTLVYFNPAPLFGNECLCMSAFTNNPTLDSNGYPIALPGGTATAILTQSSQAPNGYPNIPPTGTWKLMWDGANGTCSLTTGTNTTNSAGASSTGNAKDNYKLYTINRTSAVGTPPYQGSVSLSLSATANDGTGVQNLRCYRPDPINPSSPLDPSNEFHPTAISQLGSPYVLRFMQPFQIINSNMRTLSDWTPTTAASFALGGSGGASLPSKTTTLSIVSVGPDTANNDGWFSTNNRTPMLFTTSAPHGLSDGQYVLFSGFTPGGNPQTPIDCIDTLGNHYSYTFYNNNPASQNYLANLNIHGSVKVRSSTTFSCSIFVATVANSNPISVNGTQSITGNATMSIVANIPYQYAVDLCNKLNCHCWINVPILFTDTDTTNLFNYVAQKLNPGLKCFVEKSNEQWNGIFFDSYYCRGVGVTNPAVTGMSGWTLSKAQDQGYTYLANRCHTLAKAAFSSYGRSGDLMRVMGAQYAVTSHTTNIVNFMLANNMECEYFCVAPYMDSGYLGGFSAFVSSSAPHWNQPAASFDQFDGNMCHDVTQWMLLAKPFKKQIQAHAAIIAPLGASLCSYEGSPQSGIGSGSTSTILAATSVAWGRHPRMRDSYLELLQQCQDGGMQFFIHFDFCMQPGQQSATGSNFDANWPAVIGYNMQPGWGTEPGATNLSDPTNIDGLRSLPLQVLSYWTSLTTAGPGVGRPQSGVRPASLSRPLRTHPIAATRPIVPGM